MIEKKDTKKHRQEVLRKAQKIIELVLAGWQKADAYRKVYNYKGKNATRCVTTLFKQPYFQDMLECAKQRAAQQIAERAIWTKEQATETLKGVIKECSTALQKKMNMPAVVGITNAVKELNAMNNLTGKDINLSQSTVIFQDESKLED